MVKLIESKKLEYYLLAIFIVSISITLLDFKQKRIPIVLILIPLFLLYTTRLFMSFRHWKLSKGISVINAFLNFQILQGVLAISYLFLGWPGRYLLIFNTIRGPWTFVFIIVIFLMLKWSKINKVLYWSFLKENTVMAIILTLVCLVFYFTVKTADMIPIQH